MIDITSYVIPCGSVVLVWLVLTLAWALAQHLREKRTYINRDGKWIEKR